MTMHIRSKIDVPTEEMNKSIEGIEFSIENYEDKTVGIQIGNRIVEVYKRDLIQMVKSLEINQ